MMIAAYDDHCSIDIASNQTMKHRQRVCGDTFIYRKLKDEGRWVAVLSDGLGSGIKANVLSTLTATMALNYTAGFRDLRKSAETIMRTLPVCRERKISYATFTIVDIDANGDVRIINYDNPLPIVMRNGLPLEIPYTSVEGSVKSRRYVVSLGGFKLQFGDRIVLCSDGVSQAGMGSGDHPFGWGIENVGTLITGLLSGGKDLSARHLAKTIVQKAIAFDRLFVHDDVTCAVMHYRQSRELLIVTGPPVQRENDARLATMVAEFSGDKIICGGTTAKILGREMNKAITFRMDDLSSSFPPISHMEGFDMVTEGIITLHAVEKLLKNGRDIDELQPSPAREIVERMLACDCIHFLTGTRINEAWQDPDLPDDIGLRRTIVNSIMRLLEALHQKETRLTFV